MAIEQEFPLTQREHDGLEQMAANFTDEVPVFDSPYAEGFEACGWIRSVSFRDGVLFGKVKFTEPMTERLEKLARVGPVTPRFAICFLLDLRDQVTGEKLGPKLISAMVGLSKARPR